MYRGIDGSVSHYPNKVQFRDPSNPQLGISDFQRPCGQCMNCRIRRASDWSVRMYHEASLYPEPSSFITLTYDDYSLKTPSLNYVDFTLFMKKLRKQLSPRPISFYRVGEYGSNFSRPHFHAIIFGYDFRDKRVYKRSENIIAPSSDRSYKSQFLTDLWGNGFADASHADIASMMYVAKYVTKKLKVSEYDDLYLEPEKASMSKKNPIGSRWLEKFYTDVYPKDFVTIDSKKFQPPKYYDRWLEKFHPDLYLVVKRKREDSMSHEFASPRELYDSTLISIDRQKAFLRDGCAPNFSSDKAILDEHFINLNHFSNKGVL